MRISLFCRRFLSGLLACLLLIPAALADTVDLSALSNEEISVLLDQVNEEIVNRGIQKSALLPAGKYTAGKDIPAGAYIITCQTDDDHYGIVWVTSPDDDLSKKYPSVLYEYVSTGCEEQFRITIEEGGMLNLPFAATLTISPGLLFQ